MAKIKITQAESTIGTRQNAKDILHTLEPRKIGQNAVREPTDTVLGTVRMVRRLVTIEEVD